MSYDVMPCGCGYLPKMQSRPYNGHEIRRRDYKLSCECGMQTHWHGLQPESAITVWNEGMRHPHKPVINLTRLAKVAYEKHMGISGNLFIPRLGVREMQWDELPEQFKDGWRRLVSAVIAQTQEDTRRAYPVTDLSDADLQAIADAEVAE